VTGSGGRPDEKSFGNYRSGTIMTSLSASEVHRAGYTARYRTRETNDIEVRHAGGCLQFYFLMDSKGGGTTRVYINISSKDFGLVIKEMTAADRYAAMSAITAVLAKQVDEQPVEDKKLIAIGMEKVRRQAELNYLKSSNSEADAIFRSISDLINSLRDGADIPKGES
jgi:hypothetical protein